MWNWFRASPRCPVALSDKEWIESRLQRLIDTFGLKRLREGEMILPAPTYFPDPYQGEQEDIRLLLDRVCGYVGVPPELVDFELFRETMPQAEYYREDMEVGCMYEKMGDKFRLWIETSHCDDPMALVALLARELALVELVDLKKLPMDNDEQEGIAELYTVYLGLGLFTANAALYEKHWHELDQRNNYRMGSHGALSMPMYGYSLALYAWLREEIKPAWVKQLRLDVRTSFKEGLRYLQATGDALLKQS